jgi:hypothetical protein
MVLVRFSKHIETNSLNSINKLNSIMGTYFALGEFRTEFLNITGLKLVFILLRVLGQVQGFRLTQHWSEYFIQ